MKNELIMNLMKTSMQNMFLRNVENGVHCIGVSGLHGSGKTTLCKDVVEECPDFHFVETNVSAIYKKFDASPQDKMTFEKRLDIHCAIMDSFGTMLKNTAIMHEEKGIKVFVFDRTPADVYAYLLAEVNSDAAREMKENPLIAEKLSMFIQVSCAVQSMFTINFILPGLFSLVEQGDDRGKLTASDNFHYRNSVKLRLMEFQCLEEDSKEFLVIDADAREVRRDFLIMHFDAIKELIEDSVEGQDYQKTA